ncbi:hypothetical protein [Nitrosopumilus adriaticus]|uniref:Uncharacterized protein n=1 Tax=Nitrosopumilus adriaticus TaxID=1580092 RepID=A0A0D5C1A2_9ARCH|nr:hypothetical protein [Nitrosopumilus adriaticus]AJW70115.1 conserved exported protein of unknown function [Nitrosopumilus adriaticus]
MDKKFVLFGILASFLLGGLFGQFSINDSFADDNLSVSREDSDVYQKQIASEEENQKAEERQQKLDEKEQERKQKAEERQQKLDEKEQERKQKAEERQQKLDEKEQERKQKAEERQQKLDEKEQERKQKAEERQQKLDSDRKKLEERLSKKINKYEEKLREIKEKYQNRIESQFTGDAEKLSNDITKLEDKFTKKSEDIRKKLEAKQKTLDSRTQKILDKINNGDYLGDKIGTSTTIESYSLVFDSVQATGIHNKTQFSTLEGFMTFNTFDKSKSNLKLELEDCKITVDDIPYNCGFGKARTTSGNSEVKDSLVILAFLEDDVIEEVHSTLKISLNADFPIGDIDGSSQVSILGPQSKISGMWFLDGTGTLIRTVSLSDDSTDDSDGNEITVELDEDIGVSGN